MKAMKPTRNVMLVLCPMLVVGFLYYSSKRLHLHAWVQKPLYDKQGFLIKPDERLPLELQYKYGNLSKGECKPGYSEAKMISIYPKFVRPASMFLDKNFKKLSKISSYPPPFGIKSQEKIINSILDQTKNYRLGAELDSLSCKRCIIIGNGGILFNKSLGSKIDEYDVVVRLNEAPVSGYEKDVGSKTTMRITYPEGAIQKSELYEKSSLFVLSAFKPPDFKWLRHIVFKEKLQVSRRGTDGFWKSVARVVPREAEDIRILNPHFIQEAAFQFIGLPHNNGLMGRGNIPTLGTVAITMALHNCDEVAVAGFGYNMSNPHAPLHYYEKLKMSAIKDVMHSKSFSSLLCVCEIVTAFLSRITEVVSDEFLQSAVTLQPLCLPLQISIIDKCALALSLALPFLSYKPNINYSFWCLHVVEISKTLILTRLIKFTSSKD